MNKTARALFGLARPIILLGVLMVHGAGVAAAFAVGYPPKLDAMLWGFIALFLMGISVNFVNEYADYETDALTEKTRYSGGSGVLPGGLVPRGLALQAGCVSVLLGFAITLLGVAAGVLSWTALIVLCLGTFGGWMYSLPPLKLAWNGGAEVANAVLGGIVLPLYGYTLLAGRVDTWVMLAFVPYSLMIFATALATTWPDRIADGKVGKRTLATWMNVVRLRWVYIIVTTASFVTLIVLLNKGIPIQVIIVSFVALPPAIWAAYRYTRIRNPHPTARAAMMMLFAQTTAWVWIGFFR
jgi:1,4-dihydroxy-2-naphthoate octaprenyltransferase